MNRYLMFLLVLQIASKETLQLGDTAKVIRDQEHELIQTLFERYEKSFLPRLDESQPVKVQFTFELINIKEVNAKHQFISVYGWVRQKWFNPLLQWNVSEFGGIQRITVDANRVWVPDILLYDNWDILDRMGGGRETYKTQVVISSNGMHNWNSPAIFNSLCDIDVTYFPFDFQRCNLKFGSWSLSSTQLTMDKEDFTNPSTNYLKNGEWELISVEVRRNVVQYALDSFDDITLIIDIGRNYFTYFINLVIPCTLISAMIFLSFLLPPECGERISLGITVLLAMTVFQQLTQQLFPSFDIPLLGQYYIATGMEIGLALIATAIVLNFSFRKNTKMPVWLRKFLLKHLAIVVCLRKSIEKGRPKPLRRSSRRSSPSKPKQQNREPDKQEDGLVQELQMFQKVRQRTLDQGATLFNHRAINEHFKLNGACAAVCVTEAFKQHEENDARPQESQTGVLDENGQELSEDELALRQWEWRMASNVLDRSILLLSVFTGVVTFLAIFLQSPRLRELLF